MCCGSFDVLAGRNFIRPHPEAFQNIGSESRGDRNITRVSSPRHQNAAHARHIVARIERVPAAANPGLEPCREIADSIWRGRSDIAQVAGAVSCRNVHTAAEGDCEMRVIAAYAGPLIKGFYGTASGAGVLVVKCNMIVNVVADGLNSRVSWSHVAEELPCGLRQPVGLTITAAQQKHENLFRKAFHTVLPGREAPFICLAAVPDDAVGRQTDAARRSKSAVTPVSEPIAVATERNERFRDETVGNDDVGGPRIVDIHNKDEWRRLRKAVEEFEAGSELQENTLICGAEIRERGYSD